VQQNAGQIRLINEGLLAQELAVEAPQLADMESRALAKAALEQGRRAELDLSVLQQQDLTNDLSALEQKLDLTRTAQQVHNRLIEYWRGDHGATTTRRDQLQSLHSERRRRYESLDEQKRKKQGEIARLQSKQVGYPPYVERALSAIREQCPQADPRVLCDHIEVSDERWQAAIEGYMGGARFSILVEPDHEAEAIRIVRALPGRDNRAKVIQGTLAAQDAARMQMDKDSIVHVLSFTHAVARDYLVASYGSVLRVDSAEALRHTRRGVTTDGMGSSSYSMFRCDLPDADLVFGATARERALRAKEAELREIEENWHQASLLMQESGRLLGAIDALKPVSHAETISSIMTVRRDLSRLESLLEGLDLGEHRDLEHRLQELKDENQRLETKLGELNHDKGKVGEQLEQANRAITGLAELQEKAAEKAEQFEQALRDLHLQWPAFDPENQLQQADAEAAELEPKTALERREGTEKALHKAERELDDRVQQHNRLCRPGDAVYYPGFEGDYDNELFRNICAVRQDLDRVYNLLKNNILVDKHKDLQRLKESFNSTFVTHL
jgi:chromosome segregation ATPase